MVPTQPITETQPVAACLMKSPPKSKVSKVTPVFPNVKVSSESAQPTSQLVMPPKANASSLTRRPVTNTASSSVKLKANKLPAQLVPPVRPSNPLVSVCGHLEKLYPQ